jgi:GT2 family glycosyltransferase
VEGLKGLLNYAPRLEVVSPDMAIVILNWNQLDATRRCVASCQSVRRIYVLNNGCDEDQKYRASGRPGEIVVNSPTNLGFAAGVNLAAAGALADGANWILLLNNDATLAGGAAGALLAAAGQGIAAVCPMVIDEATDRVWSVGGRINLITGRVSSEFHGWHPAAVPQESTDVHFGTGACLLVSGTAMKDLGGLDATYFAYWEETDWCSRARAAGYRVVTCPPAQVRHIGSLSSSSSLRLYFMIRNCLLFMRRNARPHHWVTFVPTFFLWTLPSWAVRPMLSHPSESAAAILRALFWHARRRIPEPDVELPSVGQTFGSDRGSRGR